MNRTQNTDMLIQFGHIIGLSLEELEDITEHCILDASPNDVDAVELIRIVAEKHDTRIMFIGGAMFASLLDAYHGREQ